MLTIISPAKSLDFEEKPLLEDHSIPESINYSQKIIKELQKLSPAELSHLMDISSDLAMLNFDRFARWEANHSIENSKQAIFAYTGDVYGGMHIKKFKKKDFLFAQEHLRIISGFYGLLRPLDLIKPYRLEMGVKLELESKKNLYEFWSRRITNCIISQLESQKSKRMVNLASNEYFKVISLKLLDADIITPVFKDYKNDSYKVIGIYAKKARGMMASYIIRNQIDDNNVEELKKFNQEGYEFTPSLSNKNEWVFTRES